MTLIVPSVAGTHPSLRCIAPETGPLIGPLITLLATVIPYWFRQNILRRKGKPGTGHSNHHYSFDTPLTLKGLLPPAYDEATHYRRSLAQLRSKETPLEKYIVST